MRLRFASDVPSLDSQRRITQESQQLQTEKKTAQHTPKWKESHCDGQRQNKGILRKLDDSSHPYWPVAKFVQEPRSTVRLRFS